MAAIGDTPVYTYGNLSGPGTVYSGYCYFQSWVGIKITDISDTAYRLSYGHAVYVTGNVDAGNQWAYVNYNGTKNGSSVYSGSGYLGWNGWHLDNSWIDAGWYSEGSTLSLTMECYYTGGSGTTYRSTASGSYTVPSLKKAPPAPTAATLTESTKDTTATFSWTASDGTNAPIESQYWCYKKNDGDWNYTTISNGTTRSVTFSLAENARYQAAIRTQNNKGNSSWVYSGYIYTTPSAPTVVGMNTGTYVNLTATNSAAPYYVSNVWQVSLDGGTTYSTVSGQTGATLKYTIDTSSTDKNVLEPRFRCAMKNTEGDQSNWTYCVPTKRINVYVWCPEGSSIKGVYVNDGT